MGYKADIKVGIVSTSITDTSLDNLKDRVSVFARSTAERFDTGVYSGSVLFTKQSGEYVDSEEFDITVFNNDVRGKSVHFVHA